jgi:predicted GNAT family acetyltransferase
MNEIQHEFDGTSGAFFLTVEGKRLATMNYIMLENKTMLVEHTLVDDSLKGQGIGKSLLKKLVDYSRQHQIKVKATCSFVNAIMNKTPEWQDVLA